MTFWGGNTPINLDVDAIGSGTMALETHRYDSFIKPIFDIEGSKEIIPSATLPIHSPVDCLRPTPWILNPFAKDDGAGGKVGFPPERPGEPITCKTDLRGNAVLVKSFDDLFTQGIPNESCTVSRLLLDGQLVRKEGEHCMEREITKNYEFKRISSVIEHKSPTDAEYGAESKNFVTPSLPADRDRYVDFISPKGNYVKLEYPNFFRILFGTGETVTLEHARNAVKTLLDAKSSEINALVNGENPSSLSGKSGGLAGLLKSGEYPAAAVDLYARASEDPKMLDALAEAVLWNNLGNATAKYAYLLEHHLDIDGNSSFPIAGHKSDYEIAYLVGEGDAANMRVKLDPEAKSGPSEDVAAAMAEATALQNALDAANLSGKSGGKAEFKCGPPTGIPLWQWLPAIFCWLSSILPPTISAGTCSASSKSDELKSLIAGSPHGTRDANGNGVPDYLEDLNKNGVLDSAEYVGSGSVALSVAPAVATHFSNAALSAKLLGSDGERLWVDSTNEVAFDVDAIVVHSGSESFVAYDRNELEGETGDPAVIGKYLTFAPVKVRAENGEAKLGISTLGKDADVRFVATVAPKDKNGKALFSVSGTTLLKIRSDRLTASPVSASGAGVSSFVRAGEYDRVDFRFERSSNAGTGSVAYPVKVRVFDGDGARVGNEETVSSGNWTLSGTLLQRSGEYRIEFTDADGVTDERDLTVTPAPASEIQLVPSSTAFVAGEKVTVLVRLLDRYGNPAKGDVLGLSGSISPSGRAFFTENHADRISRTVVDGIASFELTGNDADARFDVSVTVPERALSKSVSLRSVEYAKAVVDVASRDSVRAGTGSHAVSVRIADRSGTTISDFSGVASVGFPEFSGTLSSEFVQIKNGVADSLTFFPGTLAGENLALDVRVPGVRDVEGNVLDVRPDAPMAVRLDADGSDMEALPGVSKTVRAKLFDRYGNLVTESAGLSAKFSVPTEYARFLRLSGNSTAVTAAFSGGVATAETFATGMPGTPYVLVEVTPGLESNSFSVTDESGASVTVRGVSKNALAVDTYYLWNGSKIGAIEYNALYTVLAGADYGNFTVPGYLAGELLFNPGSRSMAVTALVNDGTLRERAFGITPAGKVEPPAGDSLVEPNVSVRNGRLAVNFFDEYYRESAATAYLNFDRNATDFVACAKDGEAGIAGCSVPENRAFVLVKGSEAATAVAQNGVSLVSGGVRILEISSDGAVSLAAGIRLEIDRDAAGNAFAAKVLSGNEQIGYLALKLRADSVVLADAGRTADAFSANMGSVVVEPGSDRYYSLPTYLGKSSRGSRGIAFYSKRDSGDAEADREMIGSPNRTGFEEYQDKTGIGWEGNNKTLLEFAGGANVGEATRFNATFLTVNLGDPVVTARDLQNQGAYDRSVGIRIADGASDPIENARKFDFNGDGKEDLAVFHQSGKIRLFANYAGTLKDLGYLANVVDAAKDRKVTGDFAGDGYWDIVLVSNKGNPILLENRNGTFVRRDVRVFAGDGSEIRIRRPDGSEGALGGNVVQLEAFDMDTDGKTDLIVSDESGELNIFYGAVSGDAPGEVPAGGSVAGETVFVKKNLDTGLGLRVSGAVHSDSDGAVFFDGIPQLAGSPTEPDQARFLEESRSALAAESSGGVPADVKNALVDAKLYYQRAYDVSVPALAGSGLTSEDLAPRLNSYVGNNPENPHATNTGLTSEVLLAMNDAMLASASGSFDLSSPSYSERRYKTYLRSQYASDLGVTVRKTYSDGNGGDLRTGETVNVRVEISNSGSATLGNVSYLDSIDRSLFSEPDTPEYSLTVGDETVRSRLETLSRDEFDYAFESFNLAPGATATIEYSLRANAVGFGKFFVGKLEPNDAYGDVAMRLGNVCSEAATLWRSLGVRSYEKTSKEFPSDATDDAGGLGGKFIDANGNGNPDYVDIVSDPNADPYAVTGGGYDAREHGLYVFREIPDSENGTVNSANVEIARIVADAENGHLQRSIGLSASGMAAPVEAAALTGSYDEASKTVRAGVQSSDSTGTGTLECGAPGYRVVTAPKVVGWSQVADAPKGRLEIFFSTGRHSANDGTTSEPCRMPNFVSVSDPKWENGAVS